MPPHVVQPDEWVDPNDLVPLNNPDSYYYARLKRSMKLHGWQGRPLLATQHHGRYYAITGSHRIWAAREAGLSSVPVVWWYNAWWAARIDSAVDLYLQAAENKIQKPKPHLLYGHPNHTLPENVWWLLRMEGQSYLRSAKAQVRHLWKGPSGVT